MGFLDSCTDWISSAWTGVSDWTGDMFEKIDDSNMLKGAAAIGAEAVKGHYAKEAKKAETYNKGIGAKNFGMAYGAAIGGTAKILLIGGLVIAALMILKD